MAEEEKSGLFFHGEAAIPDFQKIEDNELLDLGIKNQNLKQSSTIDELRKTTPNIVIGESLIDVSFIQNQFKEQSLKARQRYVMALGVYQQLFLYKDKKSGKTARILKPSGLRFAKIYKPYMGQPLNGKTLLIWRTGGFGDLLFIQPNLRYLKEKYPDCKIKFACGPQYQPMVETWDFVDEVIDLPFPVSHLLQSQYHAVFEGVIERCREAHHVNSYILFTRWLGLNLPTELLAPSQPVKEDKLNECRGIIKNLGLEENNFIVMQLRASSPIRTPRPEVWIRLIDELTDRGHKVVITDAPRKKEDMAVFIKMLKNQDKVFNFCEFSKTIDYTIGLIKLSKLALSTDTALLHLAESIGVKSFGIYGPFQGDIRLSTYSKADWIECRLSCSPCHLHGHTPCHNSFEGYGRCYDTLDAPFTVDRIEDHLRKE